MRCSKCNTENPNNNKFCYKCGNKLNNYLTLIAIIVTASVVVISIIITLIFFFSTPDSEYPDENQLLFSSQSQTDTSAEKTEESETTEEAETEVETRAASNPEFVPDNKPGNNTGNKPKPKPTEKTEAKTQPAPATQSEDVYQQKLDLFGLMGLSMSDISNRFGQNYESILIAESGLEHIWCYENIDGNHIDIGFSNSNSIVKYIRVVNDRGKAISIESGLTTHSLVDDVRNIPYNVNYFRGTSLMNDTETQSCSYTDSLGYYIVFDWYEHDFDNNYADTVVITNPNVY